MSAILIDARVKTARRTGLVAIVGGEGGAVVPWDRSNRMLHYKSIERSISVDWSLIVPSQGVPGRPHAPLLKVAADLQDEVVAGVIMADLGKEVADLGARHPFNRSNGKPRCVYW